MDIRFDPRLPFVWRDPTTLQVGVDRVVAVLDGVTAKHERIISAIASGHGRAGVGPVAQRAGCSPAEVTALVDRLTPALIRPRDPRAPTVHVSGTTVLAGEVRELVASLGVVVEPTDGESALAGPAPSFGIAVADHVHDPVLARVWLGRDVPHLQVVTGDRTIRIGPVVRPGLTACAHCLDLHRADHDSSWGVLAAQLWGRRQIVPTLLAVREAATRIARRAIVSATTPAGSADDSVVDLIDVDTGEVMRSTTRPHPDCGCAVLPRTGSVGDPTAPDPGPGGSTTDAAVAVPA